MPNDKDLPEEDKIDLEAKIAKDSSEKGSSDENTGEEEFVDFDKLDANKL